ncbi:helix-turn-helix domain-containing protein [Marinomonas sp. TI.3.20]|uniref:helix-turn-helix domain-containing protein n=1 Tax=Marinomonas sp. TI.3.20 TaxID=3121296 RepID=UPI00311F8940
MQQDKSGSILINRAQAAQRLGVSSQTLSVWASTGRYNLRYVKVGSRVMYRITDLEAFLESRTVSNSGELVND